MKLITHKDIINLNIKMEECLEWALEVYKNKDKYILPPKYSFVPKEGQFCNIMPSITDNKSVGGVKTIVRNPKNFPSLNSKILIFDLNRGGGNLFRLLTVTGLLQ